MRLSHGDLLDCKSLGAILGDAKIVVHLGLGHGRAIVKGTRNLLKAAEAAGVERFVHISTTAVYGLKPPEGCETEEAPMRRSGDIYCDNKLRAERAVLRYSKRGLPAVILRPSIVYGPYSRWCTNTIQNLRQGKVTLIDGGAGKCNTTYVDNFVDAIFLACENERAVGQTCFITDAEGLTWGDFIRAHASMLDPTPALPQISSHELSAYYRDQPGVLRGSIREARRILVSPEFREMVKRTPLGDSLLTWAWYRLQEMDDKRKDRMRARLSANTSKTPKKPDAVPIPDLATWQIQSSKVAFSIAKAQKLLNFAPRVPFAMGIRLTEQWLRFANYL